MATPTAIQLGLSPFGRGHRVNDSCQRQNLSSFLAGFRDGRHHPTSPAAIQKIARQEGCSIEFASKMLDAISLIRSNIEYYIGGEVGDALSISRLYAKLSVDFGLSPADCDNLHPNLLSMMLVYLQRWREWGAEERQDVLARIDDMRRSDLSSFAPAASAAFLKALVKFPVPELISVASSERAVSPNERITRRAPGESGIAAIDTATSLDPRPRKSDGQATPPTTVATSAKGKGPKMPSKQDFNCYRLSTTTGWKQAKIAHEVLGSDAKQGMVSKAVGRVVAWREAGNEMPDLDESRPRIIPTDPSKLDLGPRSDRGRRRNT